MTKPRGQNFMGEYNNMAWDLEALRADEERYRTLVETMTDGISEIDRECLSAYVNDRMCEIWGYSREEIIGRPITDFLDDENIKVLRRQLAKQENIQDYSPYELVWTRKDGRKIQTNISPAPLYNKNGNLRGSFAVITDISERYRLEAELRKAQNELEKRVRERTVELEAKARDLEEVNIALKVLLKRREEDKIEFKENIQFNMRQLLAPYIEKLKNSSLNRRQKTFLEIVESTINDIISPLIRDLSGIYNLTPTEIHITNFIKNGKITKEIAGLLNLSPYTIESHRKNIRKKIGIQNKSVNLRTYLLSTQ